MALTIKDVQDFINGNQEQPEVKEFLTSLKQVDFSTAKGLIETSDEGKAYLSSFADSKITKAIKTYEEKTLNKKIDEEISKRYPNDSEEAKEIKRLRAEFEKVQNESKREKQLNNALKYANEKKIPAKYVDKLIGDDDESTYKNLDEFGAFVTDYVKISVEEKFKQNGTSAPDIDNKQKQFTADDVSKMTREQFLANAQYIK
jgi:hypothetical protein